MAALETLDGTNEFETNRNNPNLLLRVLWFVFVGWWLGFWAIIGAYLCLLSIILAPVGIALIDRLPRIMTLRAPAHRLTVSSGGSRVRIDHGPLRQRSWAIRLPWLLLVGWWFGAIWLLVAYLVSIVSLGLGLPISFWMFGQAPRLITLYRS